MLDFRERIKKGVIIADGAMGTMLYSLGVPKGHCYDELNLSNPDIVKTVHRSYVAAGAELVETNTFGANRFILERYYNLGKKVRDINYRGAKIAREVAGDGIIIGGSVGPITRPYESAIKLSKEERRDIFREQITPLLDGGVDIIIFETMAGVEEIKDAIFALQKLYGDFPFIAQFSFMDDGKTLLGVDGVNAARELKGVEIMGANCGSGPKGIYSALKRMGCVTDAVLSAQPNAGYPGFVYGRFLYPATPSYFAEYARRFVDIGVTIIGGCCGTTPEHIRAIKESVSEMKPKPRKIATIRAPVEKVSEEVEVVTQLKKKLQKGFVYTMEIDPPRGGIVERELAGARLFKKVGGDAINIADNPMAKLRMSALPLAYLIKRETGLECILHFTCRDRNILALQSELLGAAALGINNILALTGDPPSVGDYPFAVAVFEITAKELVETIGSINHGYDRLGNPLAGRTNLFVGIASPIRNVDPDRIWEKINLGAGFIQTQPVFDIELLRKFISFNFGIPVIAGLLPLHSIRQAEYFANEVPGMYIPEEIIERMKNGESGICIAKELLKEIRKTYQGVCIMPQGRYEIVKELMGEEVSI
ncbi:MAG: bifunctional homocysteine S-methyltransferase/methylenetetrahydrofolate reductase [bacterium (Candidatus Stahlbacteria) CG08_land_8_20_14_0_20_40_26]|nr:MAG: bifunctional homocysteine S-methyltransferase/methylenetetrahydrofolate reductase [bacterium (Candidatus Stahlbacteria) CG23_combo_of_CG06-09_8_20_14_all_40_9]PIS25126.1 MAG: bifunctional homocysteine S-methyltransferase/methylenetetrahydrofolate reductase [bacterium (Candidatus Stahlbacteria) CG08_land_8_20_14_0_20_40_26]